MHDLKIKNWIPVLILWLGVFASASAAERFITLASTTSTQASGLFDYLLPKFTEKSGVEVRVVAVGTGQALKLGEKGDADVLLVHDPAGEEKFVKQGYGVDRRLVMYNNFVIVGPAADPAHIKGGRDAVAAFKAIAQAKATFLSRGDDSGTHRQELRLWEAGGIDVKSASGTWYKELGAGMGAALNTAAGLTAIRCRTAPRGCPSKTGRASCCWSKATRSSTTSTASSWSTPIGTPRSRPMTPAASWIG